MATPKRPIIRGREKVWEEHYRKAAESHWTWQMSAAELRRAMNILYKEVKRNFDNFTKGKLLIPFTPVGPCMMLAGQMLEALFKAVLVSQNGAFNKKDEFAHKTHDLLVLADRVGFNVSDDEAWLLERLTHFVEWAGKYPIALTSAASLPRTHPDGGFGGPTYSKMGKTGDIEVARDLAGRIEKMLPAKIDVPGTTKRRVKSKTDRHK